MSLTDRKSIDLAEHSGEKKEVSGKGLGKILEVKAIPVSICIFLLAFGYYGLVSFLRLYGAAENLGESVSYFFVIFAVSSLLIRPFAGRLQDRRGDNIIMYPGIVTQAVGLFYLAWRPSVLSLLICAIFCAIGYGTLNSSINAIVNRQAAPGRRAYAVSTFWLFCDCGMGLGPVLLGMVGASGGYRAIFYIAAVITAFTFPVYYFFWGRHAPPATENCS
jgi:MFS family permease